MNDLIKEYTIALLDQIGELTNHPHYKDPVILRCKIDTISRLPVFYFVASTEEVKDNNDGDGNDNDKGNDNSDVDAAPQSNQEKKNDNKDNNGNKDDNDDGTIVAGGNGPIIAQPKKHIDFQVENHTTPKFVEYKDHLIYRTTNGEYIKLQNNEKYTRMGIDDLDILSEKMLIKTFGIDYNSSDTYHIMKNRYAQFYDNAHPITINN